MLSYLHEFHAGNHADILKHITLSQILRHLNAKNSPYTFFDTHAGSGLYSLQSASAEKTGEAKNGILQLIINNEQSTMNAPEPIQFYLDIVSPYIDVACYPGSPLIEHALMKSDSTLFLSELHPSEFEKLRENVLEENGFVRQKKLSDGGFAQPKLAEGGRKFCATKIEKVDGLKSLVAKTPPAIKRGAVLIDPAYEDLSEFDAVTKTICKVHKKWSAAIIALWYPLLAGKKNHIEKMLSEITTAAKTQNANTEIVRAEFLVDSEESIGLFGSGMLVINAPWKLGEQLQDATDFLKNAICKNIITSAATCVN